MAEAAPVAFGREAKKLFFLDPDYTFVNHGSYGAVPRSVMAKQREVFELVETNPDKWFRQTSYNLIRASLNGIADFVGTQPDNLVFVTNATFGANCVFESLKFENEDVVLCFDCIYPAVRNSLVQAMSSAPHAQLVEIHLEIPILSPEHVVSLVERALDQYAGRIKLAVFDHISWATAAVLPVKQLVEVCHGRGVMVFIDGAHALGQIPLRLDELDADVYVANCHKWLYAPKGTAILWVPPRHQPLLRPPVTSHEYKGTFHKKFWMQGTRDESGFVAAAGAMEFYEQHGGAEAIQTYCHTLAQQAAQLFIDRLQCERVCPASMNASLCMLRLPLPDPVRLPALMDTPRATKLMRHLMEEHHIIAAMLSYQGFLHIRLSAQIYNDIADYERLVEVLEGVVANQQQVFESLGC